MEIFSLVLHFHIHYAFNFINFRAFIFELHHVLQNQIMIIAKVFFKLYLLLFVFLEFPKFSSNLIIERAQTTRTFNAKLVNGLQILFFIVKLRVPQIQNVQIFFFSFGHLEKTLHETNRPIVHRCEEAPSVKYVTVVDEDGGQLQKLKKLGRTDFVESEEMIRDELLDQKN